MDVKRLNKYADLIIRTGVNLQKGEMLVINAPIDARPLVERVVVSAYRAGARNVEVTWSDETVSRAAYRYRTRKQLETIPEWQIAQKEHYIFEKTTYLRILCEDPETFKGLNADKVAAARRASGKAFRKFREYMGSNKLRWCIVAYPHKKWAKKMFPSLNATQAVKKQWEYIAETMRLNCEDPIAAWQEHQNDIIRRCKVLNGADIKEFRYENSIGTDFTIGMPEGYVFCGGAEKGTLDGVFFTANMPTEEVFSSPDRNTANGKLVASMPLCRNGQIIDDFWIEFKDGKIIDYGAKVGYDNLKSIIETDEGSRYLGEIALVGANSKIRNLNALFYETLFDENASCHFAIGDCYPSCLICGESMTKEELLEHGLNSSIEHVDFMVGTQDLKITAITRNGEELSIFDNGEWTI